jgi:hypothetical protein
MRPIVLFLAFLALVVAAVVAAPPPAPALAADRSSNRAAASSAAKPTAQWDDYRLIIDRNIFSRDRTSPSARRPSYTPRSLGRTETEMILCGVAAQDGTLVAFFEDDQTGETTKLGLGQRIRGGSIAGITLDGVDYQTAAGIRRVAIGQTLSGAAAVLASTSAPSPTSAPSDSGAAPIAGASSGTGDKAIDDIVERMKRRRLAELGGTNPSSSSQPATQDSKNAGASSDSTPASPGSVSPSSQSSTGSIEQ